MPPPLPRLLPLLLAAGYVFFLTAPVLPADPPESASPAPSPSLPPAKDPAAEKIADAIAAAPTKKDGAALLDAASPDLLRHGNKSLVTALGQRHQSLVLAGDYTQAETLGEVMLLLADRQGDDGDRAIAQAKIGGTLTHLGEYAAARGLLETALRYHEEHPKNTQAQISAAIALAILHLNQADYVRAQTLLTRALVLCEKIGWKEGVIPCLNTLGNVYRAQGQQERALDFFERARQTVGDDNAWNMAFIFNNIGQSYEQLGDLDRAIDYINRSREVARRVKFRPREATSLAVLGKLHLDRGEADLARRDYASSLALSLELKDSLAEGRARLGLAEAELAGGHLPEALSEAEAAGTLYRRTGQRTELASARVAAGRCLRAQGRVAEARTAFEEAIAEIEQTRGQVAGGAEEAEQFFEEQVAPYQELVALLVAQGDAVGALRYAERTSARTLLDILAVGNAAAGDNSLTDMQRTDRHRLNLQLASLNRALAKARTADPADPPATAALEEQVRAARVAREAFEMDLRTALPALGRFLPAGPGQADDPQADAARILAADPSAVLLRFAVTPHETFLFVIKSAPPNADGKATVSVRAYGLGVDRPTLARRVEAWRAALADRALSWQGGGRALYDLLLKPSEDQWRGAGTLILVPDGPLWELPFQALPDPDGQPLLATHGLQTAPSLAFLSRSRQSSSDDPRPASPNDGLLAFGNPDLGDMALARHTPPREGQTALMSGAWEPLPEAESQVHALAQLYPVGQSKVFTGAEAQESVAKREAGNCAVLHFATHGVLNSRNPLYSYLLLSQGREDGGEDGLLEAWELMRLPLHARLAVLAACETARGRVGDGEGIIGLSWALFAAGCPACVVSQWKVDSASSTALMVEFHRQLLAGTGRAEALRRASLTLASRPEMRHPFYWAPFVLIGDGS